jgi:hypothetical protein
LISKTVNPIHFDDYSGIQFERLVFAYHLRVGWTDLVWHGQSGGDDGRDVGGYEPLADARYRRAIIQCVNRKQLTFQKATRDMTNAINVSMESVEAFKFVCRGNVSNRRREQIADFARSLGISSATVWSGTEFEENLRLHAESLLKRFVEGVEFPDAAEDLRDFVDSTSTGGERTSAELLAEYKQAFLRTYGSATGDFVPVRCTAGDQVMTSAEVSVSVLDNRQSMLLRGPSGCGKSMLALDISLRFIDRQGIVVLLQGKDLFGQLNEALDREVSLLGVASCAVLLRAARIEGYATLIVIDGYNECTGTDKITMARSLSELAKREGSCLLITSQTAVERVDLLKLSDVRVETPDEQQKTAIAGLSFGTEPPAVLQPLLDFVSNGLEARLVGEVGRSVPPTASRYALFDAYARKRLGAGATEGIQILSKLANSLMDRVAFSVSIRDFERLLAANNVPPVKKQTLETANILVQRGDRISFRHELFLNAFAAEGMIRRAQNNSTEILRAISMPRYADAQVLLIGAIDDQRQLGQVLAGCTDPRLLIACRNGECGDFAREWVNEKTQWLVSRVGDEVQQIGFVAGVGWGGAGIDPSTIFTWSPSEKALLTVLAEEFWHGRHLDAFMGILASLDQQLEDGRTRLREPGKGMSLRSALFADAYLFGSAAAGVTHVTSAAHNGTMFAFRRSRRMAPPAELYKWLARKALTSGQMYVLISLCLQMDISKEAYGAVLPQWLTCWSRHPYHLRLDLLHLAVCCGGIAEPHRGVLVETLNNMLAKGSLDPVFNGSVFEALERLGALEAEEEAHLETVRQQLRTILSASYDTESWSQAASLYVCQFDHPLSQAYWQAIEELADSDRKTFLWMACKGWGNSAFFLSTLMLDVAKHSDPRCVAALSKWAQQLPEADTPIPQDAIECFVIVRLLLGKLNCELPDQDFSGDSHAGEALRACGRLYYWMSRPGGNSDNERDRACDSAWFILMQHDRGVGLSTLYLCDPFIRRSVRNLGELGSLPSLVTNFSREAVLLCREALKRPHIQTAFFPHFAHAKLDVFRFAINIIGEYGSPSDVELLKAWSDDRDFGKAAIAAIKAIEGTSDGANGER